MTRLRKGKKKMTNILSYLGFGRFLKAEIYSPARTCFQRRTNRYGSDVGTWSNHMQYLLVNRDIDTGKFVPKIRQVH